MEGIEGREEVGWRWGGVMGVGYFTGKDRSEAYRTAGGGDKSLTPHPSNDAFWFPRHGPH